MRLAQVLHDCPVCVVSFTTKLRNPLYSCTIVEQATLAFGACDLRGVNAQVKDGNRSWRQARHIACRIPFDHASWGRDARTCWRKTEKKSWATDTR